MRFLADDGNVFEDHDECKAHEEALDKLESGFAEIEVFLDETRKDAPERSKSMYRRVIREWMIWQHAKT